MPPSDTRCSPAARLLAIALGSLSLGSALALAGVSAWLITRAWQMPPVLDLSVAVVAVRTLGISRGVLGYCERLASHDTALRAADSARSEIYRRLAHGPADVTARLHSGDLLSRVGTDVDTLADVLVRALVPIGVATVLGVAAVAVIAVISPAAAVVLAVCLLIAGVLAPWLAARAARAQEDVAAPASRRPRHRRDHRTRARRRTPGRRAAARRHRGSRSAATGLGVGDRPAAARPRRRPRFRPLAIGVSVLGAVDRRHRHRREHRAHHAGGPDVVAALGVRSHRRAAGRCDRADPRPDRRRPTCRTSYRLRPRRSPSRSPGRSAHRSCAPVPFAPATPAARPAAGHPRPATRCPAGDHRAAAVRARPPLLMTLAGLFPRSAAR